MYFEMTEVLNLLDRTENDARNIFSYKNYFLFVYRVLGNSVSANFDSLNTIVNLGKYFSSTE